jgi:hypothetical protein
MVFVMLVQNTPIKVCFEIPTHDNTIPLSLLKNIKKRKEKRVSLFVFKCLDLLHIPLLYLIFDCSSNSLYFPNTVGVTPDGREFPRDHSAKIASLSENEKPITPVKADADPKWRFFW